MQSPVVCSFFKESLVRHPETGEALALDPTEAQLLEPDHLLEIPSFNDELEELLGAVKPFGDAWQNDFYSTKNLIKQLATLDLATQHVLKHHFNACLFLRPDLTYLDDFGPLLNRGLRHANIERPTVFLPNWGAAGGKNDLFALCVGTSAIEAYGRRIRVAKLYCETLTRPLHAERLLAFSLRSAKITIKSVGLRAVRTRADGQTASQDFSPDWVRRLIGR